MAERYRKEQFVTTIDDQLLSAGTNPVVLMVTGKTGSGKSTALNNIFDLHFEARNSPTSVTQAVTGEDIEKNGVTLRIIDTPGLGAVNLKTEEIVRKMDAATKDLDFTLLYCLSVKPSDTLTETDKIIVKNLQSGLGSRVWDKCVLLLTFSDVARCDEFSSQHQTEDYIAYLQGHVRAFHLLLQQCGAEVSGVKTIFEYDRQQQVRKQQESVGEIVAVPVKKSKSNEPNILPRINSDWTESAFIEIKKTSQLRKRKETNRTVTKGSVAGVVMGAGIGAVVGVFSNPLGLGMPIGACIGATVGVAVAYLISTCLDKSKRSQKDVLSAN